MRQHQCIHCADAMCLEASPVLIHRSVPQRQSWISSRITASAAALVTGCPFTSPKFTRHQAYYKCSLCTDRVQPGLDLLASSPSCPPLACISAPGRQYVPLPRIARQTTSRSLRIERCVYRSPGSAAPAVIDVRTTPPSRNFNGGRPSTRRHPAGREVLEATAESGWATGPVGA